ncbi:MAG TPA: PTS sugar transporter subunit IIC [Bacilli bacterium]|nr:PTS sugar transporter subunit IIC [Bacilli bacterium]
MEKNTFGQKILNYFVKTLNGMALGLFSTLIIGAIIGQIGDLVGWQPLIDLSGFLKSFMGIGIGLGVAWSLGLTGLPLIAGAVAGGVATKVANDPMVAYLTAVAAIEGTRNILRKKTPVDILLVPAISVAIAFTVANIIGGPVSYMMQSIGRFVQMATEYQPFMMGVIIAVVMGMVLTAPISSAAIAYAITLNGIAGGAALIGGVVQMIGFAVMSRKDNNIGQVLSIAFGTSMLQFKNVLRKPIIWLPTIIVSAILGPVSTIIFKIETAATGSGMGTSGLVGQFATLEVMGYTVPVFISIFILHFVLPIVLVFAVDWFFRKKNWIKPGDLRLDNE